MRLAPVLMILTLVVGASLAAAHVLPQARGGWELVVLGIAQDAGIPQLGCDQELCRSIRDGKRKPERVASLGS
jgi:hypothetical protein